VVYLRFLDKLVNKRFIIDTSGAFGMFIIAGIEGGIWSAIFTEFQIRSSTKSSFVDAGYHLPLATGARQIGALGSSIGIAALVGTFIGIILKFGNKNNEDDQFSDATYWLVEDDGISYREVITSHQNSFIESQVNIRQDRKPDEILEPRNAMGNNTVQENYY
jgi:hypothetical protein